MSLQIPNFVVPQGYPNSPDIVGNFARGYQATRGVVDDMQAGDLIRRLYLELGQGQTQPGGGPLDQANAVRAAAVMNPTARAAPSDVVNGSIDAARGATDLDLARRLGSRYPGAGEGGQEPAQDIGIQTADASPADFLQSMFVGNRQAPASPQMSSYYDAVSQSESGGDPNAKNPNSSAAGLFGFTDPTWSDLVASNPNAGLTPDGKMDPAQQQIAMRLLTIGNAKALRSAGLPVTPSNLYSAHFLGAHGAVKVLGAPDDTPMSALVDPNALSSNPSLGDMTAADFRQWATAKSTNGGQGYSPVRLGPDGSRPVPMQQIAGPDISPELIAALGSNSVTRPIASALVQARVNGLTADRFQTFKMDDGLYQMDVRNGQITPIKAGAGATAWRSVTDPAERAQLGISDDDGSLYQVNADNQLRKVSGDVNAGSDDAQSIADAIASGDQPPVLTGLYKLGGPVRANLAKKGYDLTRAQQDWTATQKYLATLNGTQQTRLRQATEFLSVTLDNVKDLADQWDGSGFPPLNRAALVVAMNDPTNPKRQSLATRLNTAIADITSEIGVVYMGGNSPTDHGLELAGENLKADWSRQTFDDAVAQLKKNLGYRLNSLKLGTAGIPDSQYSPEAPPPADGNAGVTAPDGNQNDVQLPDPLGLNTHK